MLAHPAIHRFESDSQPVSFRTGNVFIFSAHCQEAVNSIKLNLFRGDISSFLRGRGGVGFSCFYIAAHVMYL